MMLLKNINDLQKFISEYVRIDDEVSVPSEYPCYALLVVEKNRSHRTCYIYGYDLGGLLADMTIDERLYLIDVFVYQNTFHKTY